MGKLNDHFRNAAPSEIISPLVKGQVMRNVCLRASFIQGLVVITSNKKSFQNHSTHTLMIYGLSLHKGDKDDLKNPEQKSSFQLGINSAYSINEHFSFN